MEWLLIAWGIVTGIFLLLLFYRSMLTRREDDQLFIDESASSMATEQRELLAKPDKSSGETGRRNVRLNDLGNRRLGRLH
jgi:hypothetical protein